MTDAIYETGRGVDIVIVNWNSGEQLCECVASIASHGGDDVDKVIIVDNGSTDGSADIKNEGLSLLIVTTGSNLGFSAACNLGAEQGAAPFVLFLNPDAYLRPGALPAVLDYMRSSSGADVGICGIRLVGNDGETQHHCARFPTWRTFLGQSTGLQGRPTLLFPPFAMRDFDHESDRDVDQVIGAFFFMRRGLFSDLGGFDERFFVYYEEMDLSLRVRRAGWRTRYLSTPVAFHLGGGTTDQVRAERMFYSLRSRILYSFKHFTPTAAWGVVLLTLTAEPLGRLLRAAGRRSIDEMRESIEGYWMVLTDLPRTLRSASALRKEQAVD